VQRSIQRLLAGVRTDLDSFSEAEAYALMASGYLMTEHALAKPILGFEVVQAPRSIWRFLQIEPLMRQPGATTPLHRQLKVADKLFFKVWLLMRQLQLTAGVAALVLLFFIGFATHDSWGKPLFVFQPTLGDLVLSLGCTAFLLLAFALVSKAVNYRKTVQEILIGLGMSTVGFVFARLHLHVFDRLFLLQGSLKRLAGATTELALSERTRVHEERQKSIETVTPSGPFYTLWRAITRKMTGGVQHQEHDPKYVVQQSKGFMLFAKKALDPSTEEKVTRTIFRLIENPHPKDRQRDPATQLELVRVNGTQWNIAYRVDEERRLIQIYHLMDATRPFEAVGDAK
jgi:hypothetical protein